MRKVLALPAALAIAGGIAVALTASQAGATSEFTLSSHLTNIEFITAQAGPSVSLPTSPMVPGDRLITRDDLTQSGIPVGHVENMCTLTFNDEFMCEETIALTNRGDMHSSFLARGNRPSVFGFPTVYDLIIDGGTFEFRNAHGSAHGVALPDLVDSTVTLSLG